MKTSPANEEDWRSRPAAAVTLDGPTRHRFFVNRVPPLVTRLTATRQDRTHPDTERFSVTCGTLMEAAHHQGVFAHPVVDSFEMFKMFEHFKHLEHNNSRLSNQDQKVGIASDVVDLKGCTQTVVLLLLGRVRGGGVFVKRSSEVFGQCVKCLFS